MIAPTIVRTAAIWLATGLTIGCGGDQPANRSPEQPAAASTADTAGRSTPRATELERAATEVVRFLRGETELAELEVADTVELYLSPEGGGTRARRSREALRSPRAWTLRSGNQTYSFAPPAGLPKLTAKAGRHFNCQEYALASRVPALATRPHVGVKLEPDSAASCLRTWNATFVFDTAGGATRLVAAVYDQWEW